MRSFELGYDGIVSFVSKTKLVDHYIEALGATQLSGNKLYIGTENAQKLVKRYFPQFFSA
jgi:hypothetical protein